jgi:hypothetical protein
VLVHLFGREVAVHGGDRVEDQLALRGHAQPALFERELELVDRHHVRG